MQVAPHSQVVVLADLEAVLIRWKACRTREEKGRLLLAAHIVATTLPCPAACGAGSGNPLAGGGSSPSAIKTRNQHQSLAVEVAALVLQEESSPQAIKQKQCQQELAVEVAALVLQEEHRAAGGAESVSLLGSHLKPAHHLPLHRQQRLQEEAGGQEGLEDRGIIEHIKTSAVGSCVQLGDLPASSEMRFAGRMPARSTTTRFASPNQQQQQTSRTATTPP